MHCTTNSNPSKHINATLRQTLLFYITWEVLATLRSTLVGSPGYYSSIIIHISFPEACHSGMPRISQSPGFRADFLCPARIFADLRQSPVPRAPRKPDPGNRSEARKGTNGVSTNGVTVQNLSFLTEGLFWVLLLTYFYLPNSVRAYLFPPTSQKSLLSQRPH